MKCRQYQGSRGQVLPESTVKVEVPVEPGETKSGDARVDECSDGPALWFAGVARVEDEVQSTGDTCEKSSEA